MWMIPCNAANFKVGRAEAIKYITLHYTAEKSDTAQGNGKYFANNIIETSAHYFVDEKEVVQSVKDTDMVLRR